MLQRLLLNLRYRKGFITQTFILPSMSDFRTNSLRRMQIIFFGVILAFCIIFIRIVNLQVTDHKTYALQSERNRISTETLVPVRGEIIDSQNVILATNQLVSHLFLNKQVLNKGLEDSTKDYERQFGIKIDEDFLGLEDRKSKKLLLKSFLEESQLARVAVNRYFYPELEIQNSLQRYYPFSHIFGHGIGYIGRISREEQAELDAKKYNASYLIGKTGIEKHYESELHGNPGWVQMEVDAKGRKLKELKANSAQNGNTLKLFLDLRVQQKIIELMGETLGCVILVDVQSAGIIGYYSNPSFNPNSFVQGISKKQYANLLEDKNRPLFDRCSQGNYPPASTIKPFIAISALKNPEIVKPGYRIFDKGFYQVDGAKTLYRNWKRKGHGKVDLARALVVSNDTFFFDIVHKMGIRLMSKYLQEFGFGQRVSLDMFGESQALLPSPEWKKKRHGQDWFVGDTINAGIGQGFFLVTPLQLAYANNILVSRGKKQKLRFVKEANGKSLQRSASSLSFPISEDEWDFLFEQMHNVFTSKEGTARGVKAEFPQVPIAGKTGTAQVFSFSRIEEEEEQRKKKQLARHLVDHGLFIGYAPYDAPRVSVVVVLENAGGGAVAANLATRLVDYYLGLEGKTAL